MGDPECVVCGHKASSSSVLTQFHYFLLNNIERGVLLRTKKDGECVRTPLMDLRQQAYKEKEDRACSSCLKALRNSNGPMTPQQKKRVLRHFAKQRRITGSTKKRRRDNGVQDENVDSSETIAVAVGRAKKRTLNLAKHAAVRKVCLICVSSAETPSQGSYLTSDSVSKAFIGLCAILNLSQDEVAALVYRRMCESYDNSLASAKPSSQRSIPRGGDYSSQLPRKCLPQETIVGVLRGLYNR